MTRQALGVCKQGHAKYHSHGGLEIHPMVLISHKSLAHCGIGRCFYVAVSFHPSWSWNLIKKKRFLTADEYPARVHTALRRMSVTWRGGFWNLKFHHCLFLPLSLTWQKESCVFLTLRIFWACLSFLGGMGFDPGINLAALILMFKFQVGVEKSWLCVLFTELLWSNLK